MSWVDWTYLAITVLGIIGLCWLQFIWEPRWRQRMRTRDREMNNKLITAIERYQKHLKSKAYEEEQ